MELKVKNIGRVEKADIQLQGITIVAGENGTGKSTLSKSLYAILEMFYHQQQRAENQRRRSENTLIRNWICHGRRPIMLSVSRVREILYQTKDEPAKFADEIWNFGQQMEYGHNDSANSSYDKMKAEAQEFLKAYNDILDKPLDYYVKYASQLILDDVFKKQINCLKGNETGFIEILTDDGTERICVVDNKLKDMTNTLFESASVKPIYITTADLMGNVNATVQTRFLPNTQLTRFLKIEREQNDLTAEEYQKLEEQKQIFEQIFNQVLEGEIYTDDNQLAYRDNWCEEKIDLQNVASGMKIFLILKRLIHNGVFLNRICLIIDEPETNLHPEWQLVLAHLLVLMNQKLQTYIYINSHSPYFVRGMEYYANEYHALDICSFNMMHKQEQTGLFNCEEVTHRLGAIYDKLAEPFNKIM